MFGNIFTFVGSIQGRPNHFGGFKQNLKLRSLTIQYLIEKKIKIKIKIDKILFIEIPLFLYQQVYSSLPNKVTSQLAKYRVTQIEILKSCNFSKITRLHLISWVLIILAINILSPIKLIHI